MAAHGLRVVCPTRCILAANLLMTGNLSAIDPFAIETWSNPEAIAVNQDPAGYAAIPLGA